MHKVLITKEIPSIAYDILRDNLLSFDVLQNDESLTNLNENSLSDYDAVISMLNHQINASLLSKMPKLKVVANYAVGVNNIDLNLLKEKGVLVGHTPGVLTEATAELTLTLMLMAARNALHAHNDVRNGNWKEFEPLKYLGPTLFKKNIGIVGFGRIGKKVAEILHYGFGANICVLKQAGKNEEEIKSSVSFTVDVVSEETFFTKLDFLTLHCPLNDKTKNWLNKERLSMLPEKCIVINTGRGELVDQEELFLFLKEKKIAAFAADVTTPEPLDPKHKLLALDNVTILPHIGSATIEARNEMARITAMNIVLGLKEKRVLHSPI